MTPQLWQSLLKQYPEANFLQSPEWSSVNKLVGNKPILISLNQQNAALAIVKNAKRGRYLEIPGGPLIDWQNSQLVRDFFQKIRQVAKAEKCVFVRFRPQLKQSASNLKLLKVTAAKPAPFHLHAEHTVIINLEQTEAELLKNMRRQTRYEVRRAKKLGIKVTTSVKKTDFEQFHQIQTETAARQHFIPPELSDLMAYHKIFKQNAKLYIAKTDQDQPIAYGLILICGHEAEYFEAASTDLNRKLPGAHALLWQAMLDLKQQGIKRFNLWGIAPENQTNHRYAGVTTFKTGFGGEITEFIHAHDLVINPLRYLGTWLIETIRRKRRHL